MFENYATAFQLAREQMLKLADIEEQCRRSGAGFRVSSPQKEVILRYLNCSYTICFPDAQVSSVNGNEPVPVRDKILLLHYFVTAKGTPATHELITFRELPEGKVYYPTFYQRTIQSFLNYFSRQPQLLLEAGKRIGARQADYGDFAVTVDVFSRVPITFILWRGDAELATQGNIVFDANISDYLPTEDIIIACENTIRQLIKTMRER